MAFTGLVPCERSSADSVWRGHITRTGSKHLRFQLVESAWSYHHRPLIGGALRERQQQVGPDTLARSWVAQLRLCRRFRQLERPKHITGVAVVAVARELAGFLWPRCKPEPMLLTWVDRRSARPHPPLPGPVGAPPSQARSPRSGSCQPL
jgi:Transposase IS116/IS110/IS902 family